MGIIFPARMVSGTGIHRTTTVYVVHPMVHFPRAAAVILPYCCCTSANRAVNRSEGRSELEKVSTKTI